MEATPNAYKWLAFLGEVMAQPVGQANQTNLRELEAKYFDMGLQEVDMMVAGVYMEKMADPELVRVLLSMDKIPSEERIPIIKSMAQLDIVHKPSQAPAGFMERFIQGNVEKLSE